MLFLKLLNYLDKTIFWNSLTILIDLVRLASPMHLSLSLIGSGFVHVLVFVALQSLLQEDGADLRFLYETCQYIVLKILRLNQIILAYAHQVVQAPWMTQLGWLAGRLRSFAEQSAFSSASPSHALPEIRVWVAINFEIAWDLNSNCYWFFWLFEIWIQIPIDFHIFCLPPLEAGGLLQIRVFTFLQVDFPSLRFWV